MWIIKYHKVIYKRNYIPEIINKNITIQNIGYMLEILENKYTLGICRIWAIHTRLFMYPSTFSLRSYVYINILWYPVDTHHMSRIIINTYNQWICIQLFVNVLHVFFSLFLYCTCSPKMKHTMQYISCWE